MDNRHSAFLLWVGDLASCFAWALASLHCASLCSVAGNPSRKVCIIEYVQDVILCYNYMMVSTPSQMPFTVAFIPHKLTQISNIALGRCCLCVRFGEYFCGASWFSRIRSISFWLKVWVYVFTILFKSIEFFFPPPPTTPPVLKWFWLGVLYV